MTTKKNMIDLITEMRHSDPDFFYCVISINDINDLTDRALSKMSKVDLKVLFDEAHDLKMQESKVDEDVFVEQEGE